MIYTASFKGLLLPQGEKQLKVPQLNTVYQVQVFEDETPKRTVFRARLVGGGRLDVAARNAEAAKVLTEGLFKERISEWQQI
jgi:hypothetical protein